MKKIFYFILGVMCLFGQTQLFGQVYSYLPALQSWNDCTTAGLTERVFDSSGNFIGGPADYQPGVVMSRIYGHNPSTGAFVFSAQKCLGTFPKNGAMIVVQGSTGNFWKATFKANDATAAVGVTGLTTLDFGTNSFYVLIVLNMGTSNAYYYAGKITITKTCAMPTVDFNATSYSGVAPLNVSFTNTSSAGEGSSFSSYAWNFGDGATSTSSNPSHTFTSAGSYTVRFGVTNSCGKYDITSKTVNVEDPTLSINPNGEKGLGFEAGAGSIAVTSNVDWIASSSESWVKITSGASGSGIGTTSYSYDANSLLETRSATISVTSSSNQQQQSLTLLQSSDTGVETVYSKSLSVYPNPAGKYMTVDAGGANTILRIHVLNVGGSLMKEIKVSTAKKQIDISSLKSGDYLIRVFTTNGTFLKKVVKK